MTRKLFCDTLKMKSVSFAEALESVRRTFCNVKKRRTGMKAVSSVTRLQKTSLEQYQSPLDFLHQDYQVQEQLRNMSGRLSFYFQTASEYFNEMTGA